ncbi:hypothetical protein [Hydrogenimonas sp.]
MVNVTVLEQHTDVDVGSENIIDVSTISPAPTSKDAAFVVDHSLKLFNIDSGESIWVRIPAAAAGSVEIHTDPYGSESDGDDFSLTIYESGGTKEIEMVDDSTEEVVNSYEYTDENGNTEIYYSYDYSEDVSIAAGEDVYIKIEVISDGDPQSGVVFVVSNASSGGEEGAVPGASSFVELSDTPNNYPVTAKMIVAKEDGIDYADFPAQESIGANDPIAVTTAVNKVRFFVKSSGNTETDAEFFARVDAALEEGEIGLAITPMTKMITLVYGGNANSLVAGSFGYSVDLDELASKLKNDAAFVNGLIAQFSTIAADDEDFVASVSERVAASLLSDGEFASRIVGMLNLKLVAPDGTLVADLTPVKNGSTYTFEIEQGLNGQGYAIVIDVTEGA